jgi:hypothetical protein
MTDLTPNISEVIAEVRELVVRLFPVLRGLGDSS